MHADGYEQAGVPDRWEPGTPHITGAVTLASAVTYLEKIDAEQRKKYLNIVDFAQGEFGKIINM